MNKINRNEITEAIPTYLMLNASFTIVSCLTASYLYELVSAPYQSWIIQTQDHTNKWNYSIVDLLYIIFYTFRWQFWVSLETGILIKSSLGLDNVWLNSIKLSNKVNWTRCSLCSNLHPPVLIPFRNGEINRKSVKTAVCPSFCLLALSDAKLSLHPNH